MLSRNGPAGSKFTISTFLAIQRIAQLIGFGGINTAEDKIQNTKIKNK